MKQDERDQIVRQGRLDLQAALDRELNLKLPQSELPKPLERDAPFERDCGSCNFRWTMTGRANYCPNCGAKR